MVMKFDPNGRILMTIGRKPEVDRRPQLRAACARRRTRLRTRRAGC